MCKPQLTFYFLHVAWCYYRTNGTEDLPRYDDHGKRVYQPSETYKLIQEQENESEKPKEKSVAPEHSRTFKALEKQLDKG